MFLSMLFSVLCVCTTSAQDLMWVQTGALGGVDALAVAVNDDGVVFMGTDGMGIFRSSDNGMTWEEVNNGLGNLVVDHLAING